MNTFLRQSLLGLTGLLLFAGLTACALDNLVNPPAAQGQQALDEFVRTLRLEEFQAAAAHLVPANRKAFLATFVPLKNDLTIIDVSIEQITLSDNGRHAEVVLEMDYFLLPSAIVKTMRIEQSWGFFERGGKEPSSYLAKTPFPPFP